MMRKKLPLLVVCLIVGTWLGCDSVDVGLPLPAREFGSDDVTGLTLVARIAHVSDTQLIDEESPARFAGADALADVAWRPHESYSTQLLDGIVRTVNHIHASGRPIDFLVHTGDACDNVQSNELQWLVAVFDGESIDPLTGLDDRPAETLPPAFLDPHAGFQAMGLYRESRHGAWPSIPWYVVFGNHDVHAIGVFPIITLAGGMRVAPLPLDARPGLVLPVRLDPLAAFAYGNVTPAEPGPPMLLECPRPVQPNSARAFFDRREFIRAMFETVNEPPGHGFVNPEEGPSWYSASPVDGVRLIGLDTNDRAIVYPGFVYAEGALSRRQLGFLRAELDAAEKRGEVVVVTSHHPSAAIDPVSGSEVRPEELRALLNEYANVVLHLAGHLHRNRVNDRGGYIEIETCSTLDLPQEGRLIEIWRDEDDGSLTVAYEMFSHLDNSLPPLEDDPLRSLREQAHELAVSDKGAAMRQKHRDPSGAHPSGRPADRTGAIVFERRAIR